MFYEMDVLRQRISYVRSVDDTQGWCTLWGRIATPYLDPFLEHYI